MNYKHLRYFWMVARNAGVGPAARRLHLTPQTLSGQIRQLEEALGKTLFRKAGRHLELTEDGRVALRYADAIFALGGELEDAVRNAGTAGRPVTFRVGVTDAVPTSVAHRLLAPATRLATPVRIHGATGRLDALLPELAAHRLDLLIADAAIPPNASVRAFNHPLGRSGIAFFAAPALRRSARGRFPAVLQQLPLLLPGPGSAVSARLQRWLEGRGLAPVVAGVFDDSALMKAFGQHGAGVFVAPSALATDVIGRYGVQCIGRTDEVHEEFFAISVERRIKHPCVAAIDAAARGVPLG